ncbi:ABC transporter ATP-binding protein [Paracoccus sp. P2]|uniref:ABC transporter ATP-binding protein n=1 Tax=Paracoccus sp. P2 TaxID=3248840 RepID=UPI00391F126B
MLEMKNVHAGYGDIKVLHDIDLTITDGEVLGVLGRNGMGKTTLTRAISGQIVPSAGKITFNDIDITRAPAHMRARAGLTTVVQGRGMFPKLTVRENLEMGRLASGKVKRNRTEEVLGYFPRLGERLSQNAGSMSGGEQQMLAIGRGLMTDPSLILLDEPSDGIMPTLVAEIAETLAEINRQSGLSIVIVEQNMPMVFSMATRCIILEKGRIVAGGTPDEIEKSGAIGTYLTL